jgi:hypothetical protein
VSKPTVTFAVTIPVGSEICVALTAHVITAGDDVTIECENTGAALRALRAELDRLADEVTKQIAVLP